MASARPLHPVKLWLVSDLELGKDEAVYWYSGQHLDAIYALQPFAVLNFAHALVPHTKWFLRDPSILLGTLAVILIYRLCLLHGQSPAPARGTAATFALNH